MSMVALEGGNVLVYADMNKFVIKFTNSKFVKCHIETIIVDLKTRTHERYFENLYTY